MDGDGRRWTAMDGQGVAEDTQARKRSRLVDRGRVFPLLLHAPALTSFLLYLVYLLYAIVGCASEDKNIRIAGQSVAGKVSRFSLETERGTKIELSSS